MIKRYEMGLVCSAIQKPDGDWVKFEDHEKVEREKEGYKALMGKALDDLKHERISRNKFCYKASQLAADKRELVEMLEEIQSNPSLPYIVVDRQKLAALIAKHKGKTNLTKKVRVCKK